eukprot:Opistho-2@79015
MSRSFDEGDGPVEQVDVDFDDNRRGSDDEADGGAGGDEGGAHAAAFASYQEPADDVRIPSSSSRSGANGLVHGGGSGGAARARPPPSPLQVTTTLDERATEHTRRFFSEPPTHETSMHKQSTWTGFEESRGREMEPISHTRAAKSKPKESSDGVSYPERTVSGRRRGIAVQTDPIVLPSEQMGTSQRHSNQLSLSSRMVGCVSSARGHSVRCKVLEWLRVPVLTAPLRYSSHIQGSSHALGTSMKARKPIPSNKVAPMPASMPTSYELDEETIPDGKKKRSVRHNVRARMNRLQLYLHDLKMAYVRFRTRRDPIPLWREVMKKVEGHFGTGVAAFFVFSRWVFLLNVLLAVMWTSFVVIPQGIDFDYSLTKNETFKPQNMFDGKGSMGVMWAFYGGYSAELSSGYRMDMAYILVIVVMFFASFFLILGSISAAWDPKSREGGALVRQDLKYPFATIVLASWDHSLNSQAGIENLRLGIANTLQDRLSEVKVDQMAKVRTRRDRMILIGWRVLAWLTTIFIMGGAFTAIYYLVQWSNPGSAKTASFLETYSVSILFSLINGVVPNIIQQVVRLDKFATGRAELNATIGRIYVLRMVNLYVLLYSLYAKVKSETFNECALTFVGQEFYRLVLIDIIVQSISQLVVKFGYYWWSKKKKREFDISQGVLSIVYRQALIWTGASACPILPFIGCLSNANFFFLYYLIVDKTCRPPMKRWNQSRNSAFFFGILGITLVCTLIPVTLVLTSYKHACGPYADAKYDDAYDAFSEYIKEQPKGLRVAIQYIASPAVVGPMVCVLCVTIYFMHIRVKREKSKQEELQQHLEQERLDKKYILELYGASV